MTDTLPTQVADTTDGVVGKQLPPARTRARGARVAGVSLALAGLLGASISLPVWVWLGGRSIDSPIATTPLTSADVVDVTDGMRRNSVTATLTRHTVAGVEVTTADSGMVTWLPVLGSSVRSGEKVAVIDNRAVVGYVSDSPLWRDLEAGARGADVTQLQKLLTHWGQYSGAAHGTYDADTAQAVAAFNKTVGRSALGESFSLASVAWLGTTELHIEELRAPVGTSYSGGSALVTGPQTTAWMSLTGVEDAVLESGSTRLTAPTLLEPIALKSSSITDPDVLALLDPLFGPEGPLQVTVEDLEETPIRSVPASALVSGPSGETCLYDGETQTPVIVSSIGGGNSTITFDQSLELTSVIANPGQLQGLTPCGQ